MGDSDSTLSDSNEAISERISETSTRVSAVAIPPTKKQKYSSSFQDSWAQNQDYKDWLVKVDSLTAKCNACVVKFTVKYEGEKAVKTHLKSKGHFAAINNRTTNNLITAFLPRKNNAEESSVSIIEIAQVYHGVNHHHSYLSTDCAIKLNSKLYRDSALAKKVHCGRTKAEAIVENCLAPKSIEDVLEDMQVNTDTSSPFSVLSDASNKGNQKLFPVAVRYFSVKNGIQNKLLDFVENNDESSASVTNSIVKSLQKCSLKISDISSYSADNASVNYGVHNSVFTKLLDLNAELLKANCNCHVIHNAGRNASKALSYDVENLTLKIYAEFSNSAKKCEALKDCFEYLEIHYQKMLRHVTTRWLSLYSALDRLLRCWPAVKKYFLDLGEDNCDKNVWKFIKSQEHELEDDLRSEIPLSECYIYFVHHYMNILNTHIVKLESNRLSSTELHEIMSDLKEQIIQRQNDQFFGSKVSAALKYLPANQKQIFLKEANLVYKKLLDYLDKYYDFQNSPFQYFDCLNLKKNKGNISYNKILEAKKAAKINNIDEDALYNEIVILKSGLQHLEICGSEIDELWCKIFQTSNLPNLLKIVGKILSIPVSNAFPERIFSLMGNLWTDERNRMRVELVKAELCVKLNFSMSCQQFAEFLEKKEQKALLDACQGNNKYRFKLNVNNDK
ncbi:uncharacterized protein LOC116170636 [Photinus pyralis]|nr:uncharacterized protein LOC116160429 [Photinus pyralis]XP_031333958.1 uncharacterized protein LOC116163972 [Photinus pyralis]XP_031343000.1 uncharacterized protein LOC116170636 [Photinus pyralis]